MPKVLITLSDPQDTWLRREAHRLGIPISELVRRTVDSRRAAEPTKERLAADLEAPLYETELRGKGLFDGCTTLVEMQGRCDAMKEEIQQYLTAGVALAGEVEDDYALLATDDAKLGKRMKMFRREGE